jgi:hypothetical protein
VRSRAKERTAILIGVAVTAVGCSALFSLDGHEAAVSPDGASDGFTPPPPHDGEVVDATDAAASADADAEAHVPTCGLADGFDTVASIPELASGLPTTRPTLTDDERTLYFSRLVVGTPSSYDIFVVTRPSVDVAFGAPARVSVSTTASDELGVALFRRSGLFYEVGPPASDRNLWRSTLPLDGGDFAPGTQLPSTPEAGALNSSDDDGDPFVTEDAGAIYFSSSRPVDGGQSATRVFRAPLGASGTPGDPVLVLDEQGFSTSRPVVTSDELGMLYTRFTANTDAIFVTTRTSVGVPFPPGKLILPQPPPSRQSPGWLSLDHCRLYFQRDVGGTAQIFLATRTPR